MVGFYEPSGGNTCSGRWCSGVGCAAEMACGLGISSRATRHARGLPRARPGPSCADATAAKTGATERTRRPSPRPATLPGPLPVQAAAPAVESLPRQAPQDRVLEGDGDG